MLLSSEVDFQVIVFIVALGKPGRKSMKGGRFLMRSPRPLPIRFLFAWPSTLVERIKLLKLSKLPAMQAAKAVGHGFGPSWLEKQCMPISNLLFASVS